MDVDFRLRLEMEMEIREAEFQRKLSAAKECLGRFSSSQRGVEAFRGVLWGSVPLMSAGESEDVKRGRSAAHTSRGIQR